MVDRPEHLDRDPVALHDRAAPVDQPLGVARLGGTLQGAVDEQRAQLVEPPLAVAGRPGHRPSRTASARRSTWSRSATVGSKISSSTPSGLEGRGRLLDRLRGAGRAAGDLLGPVAKEPVVAAQVVERLGGVLLAQGEVREGDHPRLPGPAGPLPLLPELTDGAGGHRRRGAPEGEAGVPAGRPGRGQLRLPADQQRDAAPGGRRAHRERAAGHRLARPRLVQQLQVGVEPPAPVGEGPAGQLVVVGPATHPEAEGEAAARELVDAGRHLGQQHRVVGRPEQDVGDQADPLGHGRRRGQDGQRVVARVGDPVDGGQRGEAALLGPPGPGDRQAPGDLQDGVRKADADPHVALPCSPGRGRLAR